MSFHSQARRFLREFLQQLPPRERRMWATARTLTDLGELMAQWLEGRITARPGYNLSQPCSPDPETGPLIDVLAGLCRLGYVTENSQPGMTGYGQSADLIGFASPEIVAEIYRLFRDVDAIEVHACPVEELDVLRTSEYKITPEFVDLSWSGGAPLNYEGWWAITDSWVLILQETTVNDEGLLWQMLATYIYMKRNGIAVKPLHVSSS